jgi:prolyl-tRNA synthetase
MRWSQLHIPTLREDPADAEAASHRLLVRAGFIRQLMAGHYTLLPLAVRVRAKVMQIIREEMAAIGAQEFLLPAMHPADVWRRSGRWELMGEEMFRLRDRKGADLALGMTHEEIFALTAAELRSYRDLPQLWYQFQTKFRDEPRPKSGLIRVREFTMKDSYSFDLDPAGLDRSFNAHHGAYQRIFARLGVEAIAVEASNGTMGGTDSVEFMCPTEAGEDIVLRCPACGYAANQEKAASGLAAAASGEALESPQRFDTPGVRTIEDLTVGYGVPADQQIKTLVYVVNGSLTLVLLRGDHDLMEQKFIDATGTAAVRPAQPDEIRSALGALPGSLGAVGVKELVVLADEALRGRVGMTTGANTDDMHVRGVSVDRDIAVSRWADFRLVRAGEPCPRCDRPLESIRTVEIGHIFKLGAKFTEALGVTVLGPDGDRVRPIMGSYGIGVERAMAAVVECHHDEAGIVWPVAVAPFAVAIVPVGRDEAVTTTAARLYDELIAAGIEVVIDDRDERPGVKFRDVELVGIPVQVAVGSRGLAAGVVEVTARADRLKTEVPLTTVVDDLRSRVDQGHVPAR